MRIIINQSDGRGLKLVFPTWLILNRLAAHIASRAINRESLRGKEKNPSCAQMNGCQVDGEGEITAYDSPSERGFKLEALPSADDLVKIFCAARKFKKTHRIFKILEVKSENGEEVCIYL